MEAPREMMGLVRMARSRKDSGWIEPLMAITGHRESTIRASIVTLDYRCHKLANVPGEGIDFAPIALDSTEQA